MNPEVARARFRRDGYCIRRGVFSRQEMHELKVESLKEFSTLEELLVSAGKDAVWKMAVEKGVVAGLVSRNALCQRVAESARLRASLRHLLGAEPVFSSDRFFIKDRQRPHASPWHQDRPYWPTEPKLSVWIALDDARAANGGLRVIPGSHGELYPHDKVAEDGKGPRLRVPPEAFDESAAVTLEVDSGSIVVLDDLLLHASHPNSDGRDRWSWILTFAWAGGAA